MSFTVTLGDLLDRSRRRYVPCTVRDASPEPRRSPAAKYAGLHAGLPQLRDGQTLAEFVGKIDRDSSEE